jgi:hypothetical protein
MQFGEQVIGTQMNADFQDAINLKKDFSAFTCVNLRAQKS